MINPCRDCEKKGCGVFHDECAAYQAFVKEGRESAKRKEADEMYREYLFHGIRRMQRLRSGKHKIN